MTDFWSDFTWDPNLMLEQWQWLYLLGILTAGYIIDKIFEAVAKYLLSKKLPILKSAPDDH